MRWEKYRQFTHKFSWLLLTTLSLTITNIAGDNVAVVPALAVVLRHNIFPIIFVAYFIVGSCLAGIAAWIGAVTRVESPVGYSGRSSSRMIAWAIICVCIPASALTGGIFSGALFASVLNIPQTYGTLIGLAIYTSFVLYREKKHISWANIVSFICVPMFIYGCLHENYVTHIFRQTFIIPPLEGWGIIWALVGYNAGGLRPLLLAETGKYLGCRWTSVLMAVAAKWLEGLITLLFAYVVVNTEVAGMLPLGQIFELQWGSLGRYICAIGFSGLFFSCMVPAMAVNAHCIKQLAGGTYTYALWCSMLVVFSSTFLGIEKLLWILSITGMGAAMMMIYIFWQVLNRDDRHSKVIFSGRDASGASDARSLT